MQWREVAPGEYVAEAPFRWTTVRVVRRGVGWDVEVHDATFNDTAVLVRCETLPEAQDWVHRWLEAGYNGAD